MGRLIDADDLSFVLNKNFGHTGGAAVLQQLIDSAPTVDPVKHGYWRIDGPTVTCSACGDMPLAMSNYCPHCGAVMDADRPHKGKWRMLNGKWNCSECGNKVDWPLKICNVCASEMEIELEAKNV